MCGILGVLSTSNLKSNNNWIKRGLNSLNHRGPDGNGIHLTKDKKVLFGHTRLSIIDLSILGSQPMFREDLGLSITFNGEIYNFLELKNTLKIKGDRFLSNSDTEVILLAYAHWGKDFVSKLNGMFSFVLYDEKNKTAFCARDRVGEKPMYYSKKGNTIYFSSEIKTLLLNEKIDKKINLEALNYFLSLGYVPSPLSIVKDICKLNPGHFLEINLNTLKIKNNKYWDLPDEELNKSENELLDEFDVLLKKSIKRQMISDVPIGVLLSGGVDSSIITAYASENVSNLQTFNIRFPGYKNLDETKHARLISENFGTNHFELNANDVINLDLFEKICQDFDEPLNDSSIIPTFLVSKLVNNHCTVALGGDGGDELFGGYGKYQNLIFYKKICDFIPLSLRKNFFNFLIKLMPIGMKGRNLLEYFSLNYSDNQLMINNHFNKYSQDILLKKKFKNDFDFDFINNYMNSSKSDLIRNATEIDFRTYLPEDILVKVDRASMLNSLEIRAPFLDYELIEFAFRSIPSNLKVTSKNKKYLLKKLCKRKLPKKFNYARKQGFSIPLFDLLKNKKWKTKIKETILESELEIFNINYINNIFSSINKGRMNSERIFGLYIFTQFANKYKLYL